MLRRQRIIRMQIHQLMDACLFAISFWLATELRASPALISLLGLEAAPPEDGFLWIFLFLIAAAPMILEWQGFYNRPVVAPRRLFILPLLRSCLIAAGLLILSSFFLRITFARFMVIGFPFITFALVYLKEELLLALYRSRFGVSRMRRRILLIGTREETERLRRDMEAMRDLALEGAASLDLDEATPKRVVELMHQHSLSGVVLASKHSQFDRVEELVRACELEGVEFWLVADFIKTQISRPTFDEFMGRPMLVFRSAPEMSWQGVGKHIVDFVGALTLLILMSPLLLVVGGIIKSASPGPILFRQQRAGLNGRPFTMFKFRTMVTNAEQLKQELQALNEMSGPVFKLTNDPRITPIGRWLRKFSIDEFPQLFNVLRGDMSLVGPRPLPVDEVARFDDLSHRRRLSVRPGLTCLWQVSGRNDVKDFRDWVRLDLEYIDNWSLWLDIKILLRTIPVVLLGSGAK
jgi:exopolysaccharide biosynthesis polyprenyl glycosylphosphotransferase